VFKVWYVPRLNRHDVDHLVWIASSRAPTPPDVIVEKLSKPSVKVPTPPDVIVEKLSKLLVKAAIEHDLMVIDKPKQEPVHDWMRPIKIFLANHPPSDDNIEV
jgi:hypothetical protein